MRINELEKEIDDAIDKGDFEKASKLLEEREKILNSMKEIPKELAEKIIEEDKRRIEKIRNMMKEIVDTVRKSDAFQKSLESYQKAHNNIYGKSWGKG